MKKRVTVTVDEGVWGRFSELKWERRKSVSEMVEGLIRDSLKVGIIPRETKVILAGVVVPVVDEKSVAMTKAVDAVSVVKETPRERMKRLKPRDVCPVCRSYNKDCECRG